MNGLYLIKPTSIASTGTGNSSSISANGSVTFSSCATLSLNGVFSADFDNYMIVCRATHNATTTSSYEGLRHRFRSAGTDNATASSYTLQGVIADGTSLTSSRASYDFGALGSLAWNTNKHNGFVSYIYAPFLSQPTAYRTVTAVGYLGAYIYDLAGTHNQSTSYDGITMYVTAVSFTGLVSVYGLVK